MKGFFVLMTAILLLAAAPRSTQARDTRTLRQQLEWLHRSAGVNFSYDASIDVGRPYTGPDLTGMPLAEALQTLFKDTGISYETRGKYVILRRQQRKNVPQQHPEAAPRLHTASGYVYDRYGETLINATVKDLGSGQSTATNSFGFYSLTLPEGRHRLRISYIGFENKDTLMTFKADRNADFILKENAQVAEIIVTGNLNSPLLSTQTGHRTLTPTDLDTGYSLLSSPDVVKELQKTAGTATGIELTSGLYVHGGNSDENLFLIDGTPLYQINHTLGLFSAFNADLIKNIDFYKSGFPARYGGRLASVTDVRTRDGDMRQLHGSFRIGLLDGSLHLEGPLRKERTSFIIGLRRSWLDLLTKPLFAILNHGDKTYKNSIGYVFYDFNAKVTHIFSDRSKIYFSFYSGADALSTKEDLTEDYEPISYRESISNKFQWGNLNAAINWNYRLSGKLFMNLAAVYTYSKTLFDSKDNSRYDDQTQAEGKSYSLEHRHQSTINDLGCLLSLDYRPTPRHHVRTGSNLFLHLFRPQTRNLRDTYTNDNVTDTILNSTHNRHTAREATLYAEDEISLNDRWRINIGTSATLFSISGKTSFTVDPRLAVKFQANPNISLKASYTSMTQHVHKISNAYIDLPTDYWTLTTPRLKPMRARQVTAGAYFHPDKHWLVSVEACARNVSRMLLQDSHTGIVPPAEQWDRDVTTGQGRYFGIETEAEYIAARVSVRASYTLSWDKRKFTAFYPNWYPNKFDNRHKLNIESQIRLGKDIRLYAAWTFHSGNKITLPTQYAALPDLPSGREGSPKAGFFYEQPNNVSLPAYHRMDLGCDIRRISTKKRAHIWNISLYNVYCRLNPLYVDVKRAADGRFIAKSHGYIPIIPSLSYTLKF